MGISMPAAVLAMVLAGPAYAEGPQAVPAGAQDAGGVQGAAAAAVPDDVVVDMDAVVVSGVQPGPGLWRVERSDGHVLYILGTQSPLPRGIQWQADEVRQVLAQAGAVLDSPGMTVGADVGFFRGLTLLPSAMKAMKNPDGATLEELLPAELYQRWAGLKQRYMGRDRGVEKKRPLIAAYELYKAALERNGLREGGVVAPVVDEVLKARKMERTRTALKVQVDNPREALADFRREGLKPEDLECFRNTLDIIESDLPQRAARANAWVSGDLDALRAMPSARRPMQACMSAWTATEVARKHGMVDVEPRIRAAWLEAVDKALAAHEVSFALLSIDELLDGGDRDGYVAALRSRGYRVVAPDEMADEGPDGLPDPPDRSAGNTSQIGDGTRRRQEGR